MISCEDESDLSWCDIADQNDDRFMTLINFVNTHNTLAGRLRDTLAVLL